MINTQQGNPTEAAGLGVPVFDAPRHQASDVLWRAIQDADTDRKRGQVAAQKALSDINAIKATGWANHLSDLQKQKSELYNDYVNYLSKYKGKTADEFDPRNPQMTKEALELKNKMTKLQELADFSTQVKQWHQHDANLLSNAKENNIDEDSATQAKDFYALPLAEAYQKFQETGERPLLQQAYPDWQANIAATAKKVAEDSVANVTDNNGMIIGRSFKGVPKEKSDDAFIASLATPQAQWGLKQLEKKGMTSDQAIDYTRKIWDSQMGTSQRYSETPSGAGTAAQKKKVGVEYVPVNKIVESSGGTENIPLEYQGKKVYYDEAGVLNPNDTKDVHFGDVTELYKVITDKNGNMKTESVSTEEKSKFRPTMSLHNKESGQSALMMVGTEGKEKAPTDKEILQYINAHPDIKKKYDAEDGEAEDSKVRLEGIYDEVRNGIDKESGKKTVRYIAPMDKTLKTNFNQIVDKPYSFKEETKSSSEKYNLNGHQYTVDELKKSGWTDEQIKKLK